MATKKTPAPVEPVVLIVSKLEPARICTTTVATVGARAAVYLAGDPGRPGAEYLRQAVRLAEDTARAIEAGQAAAAAMFAAATMQAGWLAEMAEARTRWYAPTVAPRVAAADKRSAALAGFTAKGNAERRLYSEEDRARWRDLVRVDPDLARVRKTSARECAKRIAEREHLPAAAVETIRKSI